MSDGSYPRTLLLNSSYEPIKVLSWQKAIILWFQEKVENLEFHHQQVRTVKTQYRVPSIQRLKKYIRTRHKESVRFCRENVYLRDNHTCQYCQNKFPDKHLTLDHVVPVSKLGKKNWTNVVTACRECNQRKGNRTPLGASMPLMKEPVAPKWLPSLEIYPNIGTAPDSWRQYLGLFGEMLSSDLELAVACPINFFNEQG